MLIDVAREARVRLALLDYTTADADEIYSLNQHAEHTGRIEIPGAHVWDEVEEYFDTNILYRGKYIEITRSCTPCTCGYEFTYRGKEYTAGGIDSVSAARNAAKAHICELMSQDVSA